MVVGWTGCRVGGQKPTHDLEESYTHHVEGVWHVGVSSWGYDGNKTSQVRGGNKGWINLLGQMQFLTSKICSSDGTQSTCPAVMLLGTAGKKVLKWS